MVSAGTTPAAGAEQRLADLGLVLPPPPTPFGAYVEVVQIGRLLFLSGMLPVIDRIPQYIGVSVAKFPSKTGARPPRLPP